MRTQRSATPTDGLAEAPRPRHRPTKWTATRVDPVFGSNSQLRGIAERYASADSAPHFAHAFAHAWHKIMNNDRYDLAQA